MDQRMVEYDPRKINGYSLKTGSVSRWFELLASMPLEKRRGLAGLEPGRADIIVAGAGFLEIIMKRFHLESILVSDAGFREGIIHDLFMRNEK
jgi:exopolyphosphatase/guanosine-5'-triphosphate,3'-diphosphate pyrophosphatase